MTNKQVAARHRAVAGALGSVRAEGLNPSIKTQKQLQNYADGKITAKALRSSVTGSFKTKLRTK